MSLADVAATAGLRTENARKMLMRLVRDGAVDGMPAVGTNSSGVTSGTSGRT